jgi:hypothetical protein
MQDRLDRMNWHWLTLNVSSSAAGAFPTPGRDLARRVPEGLGGGQHTS